MNLNLKMWNNVKNGKVILSQACSVTWTQIKRNVIILKRTKPIRLNKMGASFPKKLKRQHFYYELVEDTDRKTGKEAPFVEVVLVKDVPGVGMLGEKLKINSYVGYRDLLLPKIAIYAGSPEAESIVRADDDVQHSSIYTKVVGNYLSSKVLEIYLNSETRWTLEPWHVKLALRQRGIMTSESCITLPQHKISGPTSSVENKDFVIKVTMNNSEVFPVRCRIKQIEREGFINKLTNERDEAIYSESDPLFPEDKEEIDALIATEQELEKTSKTLEVLKKIK